MTHAIAAAMGHRGQAESLGEAGRIRGTVARGTLARQMQTLVDDPALARRLGRQGGHVQPALHDVRGAFAASSVARRQEAREADAVVLARVLHGWDDPEALKILKRAREALSAGGRLFVVEMLLPDAGAAGGLCDLHLLTVTGGKERTAAEYASLIAEAGFELQGVRRLAALPSVVVGRAQRRMSDQVR